MVPVDRPFTLQTAGCSRAVVRRLLEQGEVRRLLRGVYAHARLPDTPALRTAALALMVPAPMVPVGEAAAWAHGLLEECMHVHGARRAPMTLLESVLATGPEFGLIVYDAALRQGADHLELVRAVAPEQRELAALADGRARCGAESRLRQAWFAADLPTPVLAHTVAGTDSVLSLAHPTRGFGATVVVLDSIRVRLRELGWWVTEVDEDKAMNSPLDALAGHLRREFHRQLLTQVEVSPTG